MFSDKVSQKSFYRAFEDRHRGSRALIKERLQAYTPFLTSLLEIYPNSPVLDLGCGRGEWLELVTEFGFTAYGVDVDDGMLASCHELGLSAENRDIIAALCELPDESQAVVSAFHVVEHIPFETLLTLVREAFRVLKPAGLLILETPNPENISVGTANFYVDPTHRRPIPAPLLSFLPEYIGFYRTKVLRLQEPESLREKTDVVLIDVLAGVSPDFSVVAQKPGKQSELDLFNTAFEIEFGLNLGILAYRYDLSLTKRFSELESLSHSVLTQANTAIEQSAQAIERAHHAEAHANDINQQYQAVIHSRSWKLTKPLRLASKLVQWFVCGSISWLTLRPGSRPRRMMGAALISAMTVVRSHPRLKRYSLMVLNRFPRLKQRLRNTRFPSAPISPPLATQMIYQHGTALSPRARQIYIDLKTAMEKHNQEHV